MSGSTDADAVETRASTSGIQVVDLSGSTDADVKGTRASASGILNSLSSKPMRKSTIPSLTSAASGVLNWGNLARTFMDLVVYLRSPFMSKELLLIAGWRTLSDSAKIVELWSRGATLFALVFKALSWLNCLLRSPVLLQLCVTASGLT